MDINNIEIKLSNHKIKPLDYKAEYAVLIPLIEINNEINILFEIRSHNLKTQPGEISFPGGKVEEKETYLEAAKRETCEELNIEDGNIHVIGQLDTIYTPFNIIIYPFVAKLKINNLNEINYSKDEVHNIFTVPLDYFIKNKPIIETIDIKTEVKNNFPYDLIQDGMNYKWRTGKYPVMFYIYNDKIIWGLTARIISNFIDIIY